MIRALTTALLSIALLAVPLPAQSHERGHSQTTTTAVSTQEGCTLSVTARWHRSGKQVVLDTVLAEGLKGWSAALGVTNAEGKAVYMGPTSNGKVGDGVDYLWVKGWERNADGKRVPIGASDLNPKGWPASGFKSTVFTIVVSAPEYRYCGLHLTIG